MPRKTKKQKIVADYRRRLTELEFRTPTSPRNAREMRHEMKPQEIRKEVDERFLEENKKYVIRDLRKTVLFSAIAISVEVVLYFVS